MNRLSTLVWLLVMVIAASLLYTVKYQVLSLRSQIADTSKQLEQEKEALHVVNAEWAYLNRPQRLQELASKYLATTGVKVDHIADVEAIPFPKTSQANIDSDKGIEPAAVTFTKHAGDAR